LSKLSALRRRGVSNQTAGSPDAGLRHAVISVFCTLTGPTWGHDERTPMALLRRRRTTEQAVSVQPHPNRSPPPGAADSLLGQILRAIRPQQLGTVTGAAHTVVGRPEWQREAGGAVGLYLRLLLMTVIDIAFLFLWLLVLRVAHLGFEVLGDLSGPLKPLPMVVEIVFCYGTAAVAIANAGYNFVMRIREIFWGKR